MKRGYYIAMAVLAAVMLAIPQMPEPPAFPCGRTVTDSIPHLPDSLKGLIVTQHDLYRKNNSIGLHYELLSQFGDHKGVHICTHPAYGEEDSVWHRLVNGEADFLLIDNSSYPVPDSLKETVAYSGIYGDIDSYLVTKKEDRWIIEDADLWYRTYLTDEKFEKLKRRYYRDYSRIRHSISQISPYDSIIKAKCAGTRWDWRLISAIIFKESRFYMGAESSRGAIGLMQIKESTAEKYGIHNIYDPEQNIRSGISFLNDLASGLEKDGISGDELVKFTLASFNAGEGRIADCRNFTESLGKNPDKWSDVVEAIPLMSLEEHYKGGVIRLGKFSGKETIKYVDEVLRIYEEYKQASPA